LEGSGLEIIEVLSHNLSGRTEEDQEKTPADMSVEIRTGYLPNTNPERYRYTSLLAAIVP
jgi:hypothetical protein